MSTRKRKKTILKKSGVKKQRVAGITNVRILLRGGGGGGGGWGCYSTDLPSILFEPHGDSLFQAKMKSIAVQLSKIILD